MSEIIYQTKPLFPKLLWQRPVHFYKAEAGKVMVIAGSKTMTGAAILACEAVFRSGTGVLVLGFPEGLKKIYSEILPEAMTLPLPETPAQTLAKNADKLIFDQADACDSIIIGPGLSQNAETILLAWEVITKTKKPIVVDADGLSALAKGIGVMRSKEDLIYLKKYFSSMESELILTPHPGEALKIYQAIKPSAKPDIKVTANYIENNKEKVAPILSEYLHAYVVLKGNDTVVCDRDGKIVVNKVGGPELATAGSGDVLSGIVGSFIGQNPKEIFEACCTAVYLHGLSGQMASEIVGERSLIASDIIRYLPEAIKKAETDIS
jgi:NAD(P)H-hydrate epimerase